jgi:hypothetical protein
MTGTTWVEESGFMEGPLAITNTHSVGTVRDAIIAWEVKQKVMHQSFALPVVAETFDGWLNDVNGFHVKPEHVAEALEKASAGPVAEGNVGGGTGMSCYGFKGGIGTASRTLPAIAGGYTVGVLVQANLPVGGPPSRAAGWLDHHHRGDGRSTAGAPVEADRAASFARHCTDRCGIGQRFRGYLPGVLDGECRRGQSTRNGYGFGACEFQNGPAFRGDRAGNRRIHHQRSDCRGNHGGARRSQSGGYPA